MQRLSDLHILGVRSFMPDWIGGGIWTGLRIIGAILCATWLGEDLAQRLRWPGALGMLFVAVDAFMLFTIPEIVWRAIQIVRWMCSTQVDGTITLWDLGRAILLGVIAPITVTLVVARVLTAEPSTPEPILASASAGTPGRSGFAPYWVQTHQVTQMWSGAAGTSGVVSFGETAFSACYFLVVRQQDNDRLYVWNPATQNYFWLQATASSPASTGPGDPAAVPEGLNCIPVSETVQQ